MAITETQVHEAARQLDARGVKPTIRAVRELLGEGSLTTIMRHMQTWNPGDQEVQIEAPEYPPELGASFAAIWRDCYAAARRMFEEERSGLDAELAEAKQAAEVMGSVADEYAQELAALRTERLQLHDEVQMLREQLSEAEAAAEKAQTQVFTLASEVERQHVLLQSCIGRALPQGEKITDSEAAILAANRTLDLPAAGLSKRNRKGGGVKGRAGSCVDGSLPPVDIDAGIAWLERP